MEVFQAAFEGNPDLASDILNRSLDEEKLSVLDVRRNANLSIVLDPELLPDGR